MATKASRIALAGSNISSTGEVDADLLDNIDSAAFLSLDSNGRLGIGETNPAEKLEVNGSIKVGNLKIQDANGGRIGFNRNTASGAIYDSSYAGFQINGATSSLDYLSFEAYPVSGISSVAMAIKSNGNVGIGITNPSSELHIEKAISGDQSQLRITNGAGATMRMGITGSGTNEHAHIKTNGAENLEFHIGQAANSTSPNVVFKSGGNVGIGNVDPVHPIHIYEGGGYYASISKGNTTPGGSEPWLGLFNNANIANATFGWGIYDSSADGSFQIWNKTNNTTGYNTLTIKRGGNVGIGTTNPERPLHVKGANAFVRIESTSASQNSQLDIKSTAATWSIGQNQALANTGTLEFYNGSSSPVVIKTNGNVGIGDNTPTEGKLVVRGDANTNGLFVGGNSTTGQSYGALINAGTNSSDANFRLYDQTGSTPYMFVRGDGKVSFGGGFPNVNGSSNGVYNVIVDDGICIGDGGYTHGYIGTNGTDGDVYIAANAYPANIGSDRSVRIAGGSSGGGGPNEIVRYNHSHGAIRNYNNNTTTNKKWWSTTSSNFGQVEEYDYGNKLYFKKTRAVSGYSQVLLLNRYMPNQYDVSFELVSPLDTSTYRHFGIALNHVGSESFNYDYLVLRQHFTNSALNAVRIDRPAGTIGTSQGSSIPSFHDGTKRKIMIQKRASTLRMQVHELNGSVYTYGTISGISWTNSSGYFGFAIYEPTGTNTWAKISNLTITDVIG